MKPGPADAAPATLAALRHLLTNNERSDRDIILVYFNQGILTGSWDGPHVSPISPIGAYDAETQRVLILDVDRGWYVPYWASDGKLLEAMLCPAPPDQGLLAGETGGLIRVSRAGEDEGLLAGAGPALPGRWPPWPGYAGRSAGEATARGWSSRAGISRPSSGRPAVQRT